MTLREEIFTLLKQDWLTQKEPMDYRLDMQTNRILEIFEKRIEFLYDNYGDDMFYLKIKEMLK